jgi:ectoine hydroxylase-related dioxygenase (phytanoyl-CoA dioxygenase family)
MFNKLGNITIDNILQSPYKRLGNILNHYEDVITQIFATSIKDILKSIFPEGCFISQFTQNTLFPGKGTISFHLDPPHHLVYSDKVLGLQICVLLTDFSIENGCTIFRENDQDNFTYLIGKKGDVFYWPSNVYHSEGVNQTDFNRVCLLLNIQSLNIPDTGFMLGEDLPIRTFYEQYLFDDQISIPSLGIKDNKIIIR